MSDEAIVWIRGNIANDAEVRTTTGSKKVAEFRVATSSGFGETRKTTYHSVIAWEAKAEEAEKRARTGVRVHVEGRLSTRSYESKKHPGEKVYVTEVVADSIKYLTDEPAEDLSDISFSG